MGEVNALTAALEDKEHGADDVEKIVEDVRATLHKGDDPTRQRVLRQIIEKIIVDSGTMQVRYRLPCAARL